jgi:glycosyltransferase involved in cell wall biosynthesis
VSSAAQVWIVSNFPPPLHGVSAYNAAFLRFLRQQGIGCRVFRVGTRGGLEQVGRVQAGQTVRDGAALARLFAEGATRVVKPRDRPPTIYFTPSQGGAAVLRDLALVEGSAALGLPLVAHVHGCGWLDMWRRGGVAATAMSRVLGRCRSVICLGPSFARRMQDALGVPCVGINNGAPVQPSARHRAAPPLGQTLELLYLSNLVADKGVFTAAAALRELIRRGVAARLRCAGAWFEAAERGRFLAMFQTEIRAGTVELVGFAGEARKRDLLRAAHFFLLPTRYPLEGQPLSLIEAMSHGVVPVTTLQGGIQDLLEVDGWERVASARHLEPNAVADTIEELLERPDLYQELSSACLERQRTALRLDRSLGEVARLLGAQIR